MRNFDEIWEECELASFRRDGGSLHQLALELESHDDARAAGSLAFLEGMLLSIQSQFESSLPILEKALDLLPLDALPQRRKVSLARISVLMELAEYETVVEVIGPLAAEIKASGDSDSLAAIYTQFTSLYRSMGDLAKSLEYGMMALEMARKVGNREREVYALVIVAEVEESLGNVKKVLELLLQAREVSEGIPGNSRNSWLTLEIANAYGLIGDLVKAESFAAAAIDDGARLGDQRMIAAALICRSTVHHLNGNLDRAWADYRQAVDAAPVEAWGTAWNLAALRGELLEAEGEFVKALAAHEEALAIAQDHDSSLNVLKSHNAIIGLSKKLQDFDRYVAHSEAYRLLHDQVKGNETARRIALQEKQREIEAIELERERERTVLYSTLPQHVADRVVRGEEVTDHFDEASVLFLDIAGFTTISDRIPAGHVVHLLKAIFKVCDDVCRRYDLTKIKTIGDSYLAVCGVPEPLADHALRTARAATEILYGLNALELTMDPSLGDTSWTKDVGEITVRIGLHCGPVVAGIVGDDRLQYDIWGDTVNTASRMESTGEPGRIQCSEAFAQQLLLQRAVAENDGTANSNSQQQPKFTERGEMSVKGKGSMTTYWLESANAP